MYYVCYYLWTNNLIIIWYNYDDTLKWQYNLNQTPYKIKTACMCHYCNNIQAMKQYGGVPVSFDGYYLFNLEYNKKIGNSSSFVWYFHLTNQFSSVWAGLQEPWMAQSNPLMMNISRETAWISPSISKARYLGLLEAKLSRC